MGSQNPGDSHCAISPLDRNQRHSDVAEPISDERDDLSDPNQTKSGPVADEVSERFEIMFQRKMP